MGTHRVVDVANDTHTPVRLCKTEIVSQHFFYLNLRVIVLCLSIVTFPIDNILYRWTLCDKPNYKNIYKNLDRCYLLIGACITRSYIATCETIIVRIAGTRVKFDRAASSRELLLVLRSLVNIGCKNATSYI